MHPPGVSGAVSSGVGRPAAGLTLFPARLSPRAPPLAFLQTTGETRATFTKTDIIGIWRFSQGRYHCDKFSLGEKSVGNDVSVLKVPCSSISPAVVQTGLRLDESPTPTEQRAQSFQPGDTLSLRISSPWGWQRVAERIPSC